MNELEQEIEIWDKWTFDPTEKQFVFFTLKGDFIHNGHICFTYKPKKWIKGDMEQFVKLLNNQKNWENYTNEYEQFVIETEDTVK